MSTGGFINVQLVRAFKHGRLVTRRHATEMSEAWVNEMDRFAMTRTEDELRRVRAYVRGLLTRIARSA